MLSKIRPYLFPINFIDNGFISRLNLGLMNYAQVNSWWVIPKFQKVIRKRIFKFKYTSNNYHLFVSVSGDDHTHMWATNEVLVDNVYDLNILPFTPDIILDLGANIGLFSLISHKKWPDAFLVCLEPHPKTFEYLYENIKQNCVPASILRCGVSNKTQILEMTDSAAVYSKIDHVPSCSNLNLMSFFTSINSLIPDNTDLNLLLKVDIEGSEQGVLSILSSTLPKNCFIFIELHDGGTSLDWAKAWAEQHDFRFIVTRCRDVYVDGYFVRCE